jgi:hypothetical protein
LAKEGIDDVGIGEDKAILVTISGEETRVREMLHREWSIQDGVANRLGGVGGFVKGYWDAVMDDGDEVSSGIGSFQADKFGSKEVEATLTEVAVGFTWFREVW